MRGAVAFAESYHEARARFRAASASAGGRLEAHPIGDEGLTIDVARLGDPAADRVVIASSGLHGVEGFFGSAVQLALLDGRPAPPPGTALVLVHALNPHGFAHVRRFDADNVDLNRAFLPPTEPHRGCPPRYAAIDPLLNPAHAPRRLDPFLPRALASIARHGFTTLKQAIAGGQYEYPRGLFFGGRGPSRLEPLLAGLLPDWVGPALDAILLDFHTGLGRRGEVELLVESPPEPSRRAELEAIFGPDLIRAWTPDGIAYQTRGGFGAWAEARFPGRTFTSLCAEFGTYRPLTVLAALRSENQAYHWAPPGAPVARAAKARLLEAFAPADPGWRNRVVARGVELVRLALAGPSGGAVRDGSPGPSLAIAPPAVDAG